MKQCAQLRNRLRRNFQTRKAKTAVKHTDMGAEATVSIATVFEEEENEGETN